MKKNQQKFKQRPTNKHPSSQATLPPQGQNDNLSTGGNGGGSGQDVADGGNGGGGGSGETGGSQTVDTDAIYFENIELEENEASPVPVEVIQYQEDMCRKFDGNWQNGECLCTESFTENNYIKCVSDANASIGAQVAIDTTVVAGAATTVTTQSKSDTSTATCGVVGKKECNSNYYVCASDSDCASDKLPANATAGHCWKSGSRSVCTATACKDGFEPKSGYCQKRAIADRNTDSQKSNTQTAQRPNNTNQKKSNTTNSDGSAKTGAPIQNKVAPTYSQEDVISTDFFKDEKSCLETVNRVFEKGIGATCVKNQENGKWDVVYTLHDGDPCTCPTGKRHEHDKTCKYGKFGSPHGSNPFVSFTCWAVTCDDGYHISDHICVEDQ